jgi:serine/threonine protein kinase
LKELNFELLNEKTALLTMAMSELMKLMSNIFLGISVTILLVVVCIFTLLIRCQKRQLDKEKGRFFRQNGGHILYQRILSKQIDTVTIFTIEDLKKATNNYELSREIGIGGQGIVYKGILPDNKVVAVKRSKTTNNSMVRIEEFVQEIIALSQINHRNVVRLLGCCLEVEVPILVYEYIPNGTLFHLIHGKLPVSLEDRLRIAQEVAEALEYLHLSINRPIVHGDVKSLNILLDEKYKAKVTDFGASRMLPQDTVQLMTVVQGTLGYLDPEYLQERKLTEKSDVYSFGVVLVELLTRKTAIYLEGPEEEQKNLASSFLQALKENRVEAMLLDNSIMAVGVVELLQEVVELASLCLSSKGEERPSMTKVADKLKAIRSTWEDVLLRQHEETRRLAERLAAASSASHLSPSMYWTAQMMGMDIETAQVQHTASLG